MELANCSTDHRSGFLIAQLKLFICLKDKWPSCIFVSRFLRSAEQLMIPKKYNNSLKVTGKCFVNYFTSKIQILFFFLYKIPQYYSNFFFLFPFQHSLVLVQFFLPFSFPTILQMVLLGRRCDCFQERNSHDAFPRWDDRYQIKIIVPFQSMYVEKQSNENISM